MSELYFLFFLVLNIATAIIFYSLGKDGKLPTIPLPKQKRQEQFQSNFTDPDLEDIRDVDPKKIQEAFMASIKKRPATTDQVAEKFEEMIN